MADEIPPRFAYRSSASLRPSWIAAGVWRAATQSPMACTSRSDDPASASGREIVVVCQMECGYVTDAGILMLMVFDRIKAIGPRTPGA